MNHRGIVMSVALFVVIVAGMFAYSYIKKQEIEEKVEVPTPAPIEKVAYAEVTRITAKHFFGNGVHTYVGELVFPTPCDLLETDAIVAESFPEQITLNFDVINTAEMCTQMMTAQRFKIEASASEASIVSARFMGRTVELNIVPAEAGESPDDFELFIKG